MLVTGIVVALAGLLGTGCGDGGSAPSAGSGADSDGRVAASLQAHTAQFEPRIIQVTDGVYVAVGYALANAILLEGEDAVVIVDVTESVEAARTIMAEFRKITDKPVAALIYTHNHADHVFGGRGFVPEGDVPVYAHDTTNYYINRFANIIRPAIYTRSTRMFGTLLPGGPEGVVNAGIGPHLDHGGHSGGSIGLIRPTHTFADELELQIAGIRMQLVHAPGETNDQIFVWLPESRVLLPGDNIYRAFPNLYTIRGTLYRDVLKWAHSLDRMRALQPEHLVPSHTAPLSGREEVAAVLRAYRDAIQFVHDQSVRGINQGLTPDELVQTVRLPQQLREHPWLLEHYGTVEWSVRSIFTGYLGWFGGDAAFLSPLDPAGRGEKLVALAGGSAAALAALEQAVADGEYRWAAELASHMIAAGYGSDRVRALKAAALRQLGYTSTSPNGRHYYLTQAGELEGEWRVEPGKIEGDQLEFAKSLPIGDVLSSLPVNLDPEKASGVVSAMSLRFTDTDEAYTLRVRNSIAELVPVADSAAPLQVETHSDTWVEIMLGVRGVPGALASGDIRLGNGVRDVPELVKFLLMFRA